MQTRSLRKVFRGVLASCLIGWLAPGVHAVTKAEIALDNVYVSSEERQKLQDLLTPYFDQRVTVSLNQYEPAQVRLTNGVSSSQHWFRSRYRLPSIPAFARFYLSSDMSPGGVTAILKRPYMLSTIENAYQVDNKDAALTMLEGNRVVGILDYAANSALYLMNNPGLKSEVIRDRTPLYIEFTSRLEQEQFEQRVAQATNNGVPSPFETDVDTEARTSATEIKWFLLNKLFDNGTKKLLPVSDEVKAAAWWDEMLPQYALSVTFANSTEAFSSLTRTDNVCVMNVYKNTKRQKQALFTQPTVYYLNVRIYGRTDTLKTQALNAGYEGMPVNLNTWLPLQQDSIFGYSGVALRNTVDMPDTLLADDTRFINLDKLPFERVVALLDRKRVDYIIDYPSRLKEARARVGDTTPLSSFEIENATESAPAYVACSDSATGQSVVSAIDLVLQDPKKADFLIGIYTDGLSQSEKQAYRRDAGQQ